jgi:hypothetical protein
MKHGAGRTVASVDLREEGIRGLRIDENGSRGPDRLGKWRTWLRTAAATPAVRPEPKLTTNFWDPERFLTCSSVNARYAIS